MNNHEDGSVHHGFARWLIQRAAWKAPPALAERLEEEWLADLASRPTAIARLRLAMGCCWATQVIAHEFAAPRALAAGSAGAGTTAGSEAFGGFPWHDSSLFSRRTLVLVSIVGLHVALIYVFASGLGRQVVRLIPADMGWRFIPEVNEHSPPPPPSNPTMEKWRLDIPQIDFPPSAPPAEDSVQQTGTAAPEQADAAPQPPAHSVHRVSGGPGRGFPSTSDYYPPDSIRRGQLGSVTVQACVDAAGRLTADPALVQTSGFPSLDKGALRLARAGSGRYRPTTEDGQPVSACYEFRVKFDLTNPAR